MRRIHHLVLLASLVAAAGGVQAADGLKISPDSEVWPSWQTRLSVITQPVSGPGLLTGQLQLGAARLSGDHYFEWGRLSNGGGLRATSALLIGPRSLALAAPSAFGNGQLLLRPSTTQLTDASGEGYGATPYVGLGYSAWWARGGLGFSADLGLMGQRPSQAMRLGADSGSDLLRSLQMAPVLQVNLSYSF